MNELSAAVADPPPTTFCTPAPTPLSISHASFKAPPETALFSPPAKSGAFPTPANWAIVTAMKYVAPFDDAIP
jgi:hypothetical protein